TPTLADAGGRTLLRLEGVSEPGVYRVERTEPAKNFSFVVNVGRGDSVLSPMDTAALGQWFAPQSFEVLTPDAVGGALGSGARPVVLWPWLMGLAAGLLLLETFFVHWLCPKANPKLADVVVHRRGLLRPLSTREAP